IPIFAWGLTGERISVQQVFGIAVSCAGAIAIVSGGEPARLLQGGVTAGDLWILGAMVSWSVYSVIVKRRPADLEPNVLLLLTIVLAALMILPLWLWEVSQVKAMPTTPDALLAVAYIVLFPSVGAYFCFNRGIDIVGPNKGGLCMHLVPLFGAVLAVLFLGEVFRFYHAAGIALIFAGIAVVTLAGRQ
ncbi:MAG: DMT family transporter, partial [Methyloligellaceae bacterium]